MTETISPKQPVYVTQEDLKWWLDKAKSLEWTWAKTYADTSPHWYVVLGRTPEMSAEDFKRAAAVILTFGQPGKFWNATNIYLTDPDQGFKWWIMPERGRDLEYNSTLINRAAIDEVYGPQNAPSTSTGDFNLYDQVAAGYDETWTSPSDLEENEIVRRLVSDYFGSHAPTTLDVGCGTGLILDLQITSPQIYVGIDPSQGMLNELVLKHPKVRRVIPAKAQDVVFDEEWEGGYELVISTFAAPSYMPPEALHRLADLSTRMTLLMCYPIDWLPDYYADLGATPPETLQSSLTAIEEIAERYGTQTFKIGCFDSVAVRKP